MRGAIGDASPEVWSGKARDAFVQTAGILADDLSRLAGRWESEASALWSYAAGVQEVKDQQAILTLRRETAERDAAEIRRSEQIAIREIETAMAQGRDPDLEIFALLRSRMDDALDDLAIAERQWDALVDRRAYVNRTLIAALASEQVAGATTASLAGAVVSGSNLTLESLATLSPADLAALLALHPSLVDEVLASQPPENVAAWWAGLTDTQQQGLLIGAPALIGALDGVPATVRAVANRTNAARQLPAFQAANVFDPNKLPSLEIPPGGSANMIDYLQRVVDGDVQLYQWWSVGEVTVGLNPDDYNLQLTLNDRFGAAGAQQIRNAHEDTWITETDFDNIADLGVNVVRLPIGWTTLLHTDGTFKTDPWEKIDWTIAELAERGVYTVLDLHTVPGGGCPWGSCGRIGPNPNGFWGSADYQTWTENIWKAIATRYKGNPAVAAYDLINEPLLDFGEDADDVTQKSDVYDRLYDAVRAIDPKHIIMMGAFFGYGNIAPPATYGWTNVMYELHPYDMPNAKDWNAQNQLVTDQLAALPGLLANPGVPVLFGEYSLYYYDDVWARWMAGLNAQRQSWSNWTYKVKGGDADGQGYWGFYSDNASPVPVINNDSSETFVEKLHRFGTENFTRNDRMAATVQKYSGGRKVFNPVVVSRSGWTATASSVGPGSSVAGGIDGNSGTQWNTGADQTPGQWYQIDLGKKTQVAQVTVQTPDWQRDDYPRGFTLEFSLDGSTWTTVGSGIGFGWKRPITVDPQKTRYIRITQTGNANKWWSIDTVTVYRSY